MKAAGGVGGSCSVGGSADGEIRRTQKAADGACRALGEWNGPERGLLDAAGAARRPEGQTDRGSSGQRRQTQRAAAAAQAAARVGRQARWPRIR
eukprot:1545993-Prymnesium_polylepis.2